MKLLDVNNRIQELMSQFVAEIKASSAVGWTDRNRVSENVLIPLLSELYGFKKLRNLNQEEKSNYPAIDLADEEAHVAVQVTATSTTAKVKDTLTTFVDHRLYEAYSRLIIYVLIERQKSYPQRSLNKILEGRLMFDVKRDIIDYRNILRIVNGLPLPKAESVQRLLEEHFPRTIQFESTPEQPMEDNRTESVQLNLLRLAFPQTLFLAELLPTGHRKHALGDARKLAQKALSKLGLKFSVDWEVFENKIITFHDLSDAQLPLSKIIDLGTVTSLGPEEFYSADDSQERVFKSLLRRCLQQKLYPRQVVWQQQEALFMFVGRDGEDFRDEQWVGAKKTHRVVFERTRMSNNPEQTWYCKHFGFEIEFRLFNETWYLIVKPEWFFSRDGYQKSRYASEKVDWLKKREINLHVYNHLRFLNYFLTHDTPTDLFRKVQPYPFLTFHDIVQFSSPILNDKSWNPPRISEFEPSSELQDEGQMELFGQ